MSEFSALHIRCNCNLSAECYARDANFALNNVTAGDGPERPDRYDYVRYSVLSFRGFASRARPPRHSR